MIWGAYRLGAWCHATVCRAKEGRVATRIMRESHFPPEPLGLRHAGAKALPLPRGEDLPGAQFDAQPLVKTAERPSGFAHTEP
jgi:hypothetical protein